MADFSPDFAKWYAGLQNAQPQVDTAPVENTSSPAPTPDVPQFKPPTDSLAPVHHGLLSRIGSALSNAGNTVGSAIAPDQPGYASLGPQAQVAARRASLLSLGSSFLNPGYDQRGFRNTFLESVGAGLPKAQAAADNSLQGSVQAAQYAQHVQQQQAVASVRQQVTPLLSPRPGDDPDGSDLRDRMVQAAAQFSAVGAKDEAAGLDRLVQATRENATAKQALASGKWKPMNLGGRGWGLYNEASHQFVDEHGNVVPGSAMAPTETISQGVQHELTHANTVQANVLHFDSADQAQAKQYATSTVDLRKENTNYNAFKASVAQAGNNPAANSTALISYMAALDPKAQVRSQMLAYATQIDKSLPGKIERMISEGTTGLIPPDQIQMLLRQAEASHAAYQQQGYRKYNDVTSRSPGVRKYVSSPLADYEDASQGTATPNVDPGEQARVLGSPTPSGSHLDRFMKP